MKDLKCPYCNTEQDVEHEDSASYEQDTFHEIQCVHCGKNFMYTIYISYSYESHAADCLNDKPHDYELIKYYPVEFSRMRCTMCDKGRELTTEEREKFEIGTVEDYIKSLKK